MQIKRGHPVRAPDPKAEPETEHKNFEERKLTGCTRRCLPFPGSDSPAGQRR